MRLAITACALAGCTYQPGSFRHPLGAFPGEHVTLGCVDLAIAPRTVAGEDDGVALQFDFGNRCDGPTQIDLAHVHVVGRLADGRALRLAAFDPDAELTPLPLDGRTYGSESIVFRAPIGADVRSACVDAASIVHGGPPHWICLGPQVASAEVAP